MTVSWPREVAHLALAFALAFAVAFGPRERALVERDDDGRHPTVIRDATGTEVRVRPYARIASGSLVADRILLDLVGSERILGLSRYGFEQSPVAARYGARARIDPNGDLEALLELGPDLLVVNEFVDRGRLSRIREAGIAVFDLGPMRGLESFTEDTRLLGRLVASGSEADRLARALETRMRQVAADVPDAARPRALYVGSHGNQLYGGTVGTSYHDVLIAAGLVDVAAGRFRGWPEYTLEDVLVLAPEVVVVPRGEADAFCRHPGFAVLRPCRGRSALVEVDEALLVDPGFGMLDAAEAVRSAVHPR